MPQSSKPGSRPILAAVITLSLALAGCATTEYVNVSEPLPVPDRPDLPTIPAGQMQCLSDSAYKALAVRDAQLKEHIKRLESILRTTHEDDARSER